MPKVSKDVFKFSFFPRSITVEWNSLRADLVNCKSLSDFIIWQDSLEVNPSVLIGSFLVGILPYGPFPWKRSYAVYFLFSKAGKFKLRKENV